MDEFEALLSECRGALERYVKFRVNNLHDAEDLLQEIFLSAYRSFDTLRDKGAFKGWMIRIARNHMNNYFKGKATHPSISLESLHPAAIPAGRHRLPVQSAVHETLEQLGERDREILHLYYLEEYSQSEIARRLNVPVGTVKSRLHHAKQSFKKTYPYSPKTKGETVMTKFPEYMPEYTITRLPDAPFPVRCEEFLGWFIIPREGEKSVSADYEFPERKRTERVEMRVTGKAEIHGVPGVAIRSVEYDDTATDTDGKPIVSERWLVAQLTDTHCRILAESQEGDDGVAKLQTFLDNDFFLNGWGFGEDNCGTDVLLSPKGKVTREGDIITLQNGGAPFLDVVGRYEVQIGGKRFDTVCVLACYNAEHTVLWESFIDEAGRTVLFRVYCCDDLHLEWKGKLWTEMRPENARLIMDGKTYVHWTDTISDYVL